jgi:hypothetical protein
MYLIEPEFVLPLLRPANIRHRRVQMEGDTGARVESAAAHVPLISAQQRQLAGAVMLLDGI